MTISSVDKKRNATASWSGYLHQGKVGFLVALREIKKSICEGISDYEDYLLIYENAEDFDIVNADGKILSRHQVKAKNNSTEREHYSNLFNIQTRKIEDIDGSISEKIDEHGFQIHRFDGNGNAVEVEVDINSRYLHTVVEVKDFDLSRDEYFKKYNNRKIYTENQSCIKLFEYEKDVYFCPLASNYQNDDKISQYCKKEIEDILHNLNDGVLQFDSTHSEKVYEKFCSKLLDKSIGISHNKNDFPIIPFRLIVEIIKTETDKDEKYEAKLNLIYEWDKYCRDKEPLDENTKGKVGILIDEIIMLKNDDFDRLVRGLLPNESKTEPLSKVFSGSTISKILLELFFKYQVFDMGQYNYWDEHNRIYRTTLIDVLETPANIESLRGKLISNNEFFLSVFNNDFLINSGIDDVRIFDIDQDYLQGIDNLYKEEWEILERDKFIDSNLRFIKMLNVLQNDLRIY